MWEDPLDFIVESWPWSEASASDLTAITAKDVGFDAASSDDGHTSGGTSGPDPLFNMLMQLQEAAASNNESASGGDSSSGP